MMNDGAIRNFEQIEEIDNERRTPKLVTIAFVALGGAAIAFAALAAVRPGSSATSAMMAAMPPPATDRLSVVPLPAQSLLEATPVVTRPRDGLTQAASTAAAMAESSGTAVPAGHDGGYQLQVSSFRTKAEGDHFADQLRVRGHKAYVVEARVPGRGTWFRVRVGPFATKTQASNYRAQFEAREHVVPFIVEPTTPPK